MRSTANAESQPPYRLDSEAAEDEGLAAGVLRQGGGSPRGPRPGRSPPEGVNVAYVPWPIPAHALWGLCGTRGSCSAPGCCITIRVGWPVAWRPAVQFFLALCAKGA